ncbi:MAG: penicillin-binding protein 2 [Gammaproteobacteria bacterium]|nr:penicillin-binding protein 2 [Gammaproteobacteria bacterium]
MIQQFQTSFIAWRFYFILSMIALVVAGLAWRVFTLSVLDQHFLRQQGDERVLRLVSTPAFRGMIVDRDGFPLAVSTTVYSAWMNPQEFEVNNANEANLANLLKMHTKDISALAMAQKKKNREFIYLKRELAPDIASKIKELSIPGIYLQQDYRRYYSEGETTAQVVGITNIDDQGQEGLELAYNQWLQGEPGKKWVVKDRLGRIISEAQVMQEQKPGHDLVLSLDRRIQYIAYRELLAGVLQNQAQSGSAVVLDVKTGEVLAMVNLPSFNPNNRPAKMSESLRNRAVTDSFEPGSTLKAFSVASALDSGKFKADTIVNTYPGWLRVGHNLVRDHSNNGPITVTQILQKSSNVGVTKMILSLPSNQLWSLLHRVGFGEITGIGFPGEQSGLLVKQDPWGSFTLATMAFGYGVSVTALQLTRAYAVIANDGIKLPVSLLRQDNPPTGERVMDAEVAKQMRTLLAAVVTKGGTGELAHVPGYRVAGKTGTSILAGHGGYQKHHYTSSFVGMAPLAQPRLVVAVVIHEPQGKHYYGGTVSAPVFEKIMEETLRMLNVPPDADA